MWHINIHGKEVIQILIKKHLGILGQKQGGMKMQEEFVSDGQNRGLKVVPVFLVLLVTVYIILSI